MSDALSKDQPESWRFIDSGFHDGYENMAIDMAITQCYQGAPTLRVYGWKPPAISLGYHQSLADLDLERCARDGIDVVYRPTGGRAVLHSAELTYAVVLGPESKLYDERVLPVYERISQGILAALRQLYIPLTFERSDKSPKNYTRGELSSLCYASSIKYEVGYQGKKLIGSAQRRFGNVVLQHGSILIGQDHLNLVDYLSRRDENWLNTARRFMQEKTVCLNDISPVPLTYEQIALALRLGFSLEWGIAFNEQTCNETEEKTARQMNASLRQQLLYKASHES